MRKDLSALTAGELFLLFSNQEIDVADCTVTDSQLLDMELLLMECIAEKIAGPLVCWEASEELH